MTRLTIYVFFVTLMVTILTASCAPIPSGRGTWFNVGLGACGKFNYDNDLIVALGQPTYANGAHCDRQVNITSGGKTTTATVRDLCDGCGPNDLDMSPALFEHFADRGAGVIKISWCFV